MNRATRALSGLLFASCLTGVSPAAEGPDAARLYTEHCASCHGANRLGGMGPALLPENLKRLRKDAAAKAHPPHEH